MKIAVIGSSGQLGRDLCPRLPAEVVALTRADIDLGQPATITTVLEKLRPDVVVNCAAYNFVDKAESEPEAAFATNTWGVRALAQACRDIEARLVHVSTDYVFGLDASRATPFRECDVVGPVSVYGLSKLAGEYVVRSTCPRHLVIRTCGLFGVWGSGGKGGNFVETMLRLASQGKSVKVVHDQRCTPTYTADLATAMAELIASQAEGLVHVTSGGSCTWYELAAEVFRQANLNVDLTPISSAQFNAIAQRPAYSVLASDRIPPLRPWQEALSAYLHERAERTR